jgi:hypothetical protein
MHEVLYRLTLVELYWGLGIGFATCWVTLTVAGLLVGGTD